MNRFVIDPAIRAACHALGPLKLSDALLMNDARFPWIVLVPRRIGARELDHLKNGDRAQMMDEIVQAGAAVRAIGAALGRPVEKLNLGALGNITPQLHVHVVGRRSDDLCWPGPVWGCGEAVAYEFSALERAREAAGAALAV